MTSRDTAATRQFYEGLFGQVLEEQRKQLEMLIRLDERMGQIERRLQREREVADTAQERAHDDGNWAASRQFQGKLSVIVLLASSGTSLALWLLERVLSK